ncbi:MAG: DUF362 domain-containing protein [Novosphingobium sp.]
MNSVPAVAVLTDAGWGDALARGGLAAKLASGPNVVMLVDLGGARLGDPDVLAAGEVEELIDRLHALGAARVDLAASADETRQWAGNREVYALADLLGYRFVTDAGHEYDILDMADDVREPPFPAGSVLAGTAVAAAWLDAGLRINLARLRHDSSEGFAAGLANLLGCLPQSDKALHYRHRRNVGEVIGDLLQACPPHHTLIAADHGWTIASTTPLLADYAAAFKAGLDPYASPLLQAVAKRHPLPPGVRFDGALDPLPRVRAPAPLEQRAARSRQASEGGDRLLAGWLRQLDPALFPASRTLDSRGTAAAAVLLGDGASPSGRAALTALNLALAAGGGALAAWRTLFDKDALTQRIVSLGFDPQGIPAADFAAMVAELEALLPLAAAAPLRGDGLRWRKLEGAVLFRYRRRTAIPFKVFTGKVDIARTIGFMNDYLGGVVVVLERDAAGRSIRQAERNLYLPQPNYLALLGGKPIDVGKIEVVRYERDAHRLFWKTLHSVNGSATADDGVAFFERDGDGTCVTIAGKQRFTLPPVLRLFDPALLPDVEERLTTAAYQRFFDRTFANFEALVEGRDVRLGRPGDDDTAHPSGPLEDKIAALAGAAGSLATRFRPAVPERPAADARGFVHMAPRR